MSNILHTQETADYVPSDYAFEGHGDLAHCCACLEVCIMIDLLHSFGILYVVLCIPFASIPYVVRLRSRLLLIDRVFDVCTNAGV